MGETKIIVVSRQWPKALLRKFQQELGLRTREAGRKFRPFTLFKKENKGD